MLLQLWSEIDRIQGWLSFEVGELLYDLAQKVPVGGKIIEIGSWKGKSTICLAKGAQKKTAHIYAIDPHKGSQEHYHLYDQDINTYEIFLRNIKYFNLESSVTPLIGTSSSEHKKVKGLINLLWIDGSHEYLDVKKDFDIWFPRLKKGGWIVFHDSKWPGVKKVLWEDLYSSKEVGCIKRIEDTTYVEKKASLGAFFHNQMILKFYQLQHKWKRLKRRVRKVYLKRRRV